MANIKFFALGGLGENGKNLYVVKVDEKIFILDAGLKYPSFDLYGVDGVIPDITYLEENKDNIQGVFLSHGHEEHCGAVVELLKHINVPVFASHFTISVVEWMIAQHKLEKENYRLYRINDEKELTFGDVIIRFFFVSHSIPQSLGIAICTVDGAIVYAPDFTFTTSIDNRYETNFSKLTEIAKSKILLLASESLGVNNVSRVNNDFAFFNSVNEVLRSNKRVIFAMFSYDLNRIQKVIDLCVKQNRKIAIIGRNTQMCISVAMNIGYLKIPSENFMNLRYMDEFNNNNISDLAVIITGNRHEPYFMLQRMMTNQDRLIKITKSDSVVIISPPVLGTERIATRAKDQLSKTGCRVVDIPRNFLKSSHADSEDLGMMYQLLKPLYICPIEGEYRHQYVQKEIAMLSGYDPTKILMIDNGEIIEFNDGVLSTSRERVHVGDVLIDGSIVGDINELVLKDREQFSNEGACLIVTNIDSSNHRIVSGPKFVSKGFGSRELENEIKENIENVAEEVIYKELATHEILDWDVLKSKVKEAVEYEIKSVSRKNPVIIPVIIDVNGENKYETIKEL